MINSIYGFSNVNFNTMGANSVSSNNVFSNILEQSINSINNYQKSYEDSLVSFIKGNENEIHNVMIAMQEAKLTLQTAVEVRNKLVEAYQELSRIQI